MPALKKILCALDLSDQSESVAEYAVMLAKMSGASIVAVYAAPTLTQYTGFHVPPNTIDNFDGEIRFRCRTLDDRLCIRTLHRRGCPRRCRRRLRG